MILQMDEVLWKFSKFYRKKFLAENPGVELSADMAAICHGARHGRDWSRRSKYQSRWERHLQGDARVSR